MTQTQYPQLAKTGFIQCARSGTAALLILGTLFLGMGTAETHAAKSTRPSISLIPKVTTITYDATSGGLVASGVATAIVKGGKTYTAPFTAPLTIVGTPTCNILNLKLGPIDLNLLGLVVQTSPICLDITAASGGGLLGDLLCGVANLLNSNLPLTQQILDELITLLSGVLPILNTSTVVPSGAVTTAPVTGQTCSVLDLALGPVNLTLLGLNVHLDNCANGPVTVTITAVKGQGNLLGNLLCQLVGSGQITLGEQLQQIINQLLALLNL